MKKLVSKFMDELKISRKDAIVRISLIFFFSLCLIAIIITVAIFCSYQKKVMEKVYLPWNNKLEQLRGELSGEEVLLTEENFLEAFKEPKFISLRNSKIIFLSNLNKVIFYCEPEIINSKYSSLYYGISSVIIVSNDTIMVEKTKTINFLILIATIITFVLLMFINDCQSKTTGLIKTKQGKFKEEKLKVWG